MKALLLTVSHKQPDWVLQACADYERRLPRSWGFRVLEVKPDARNAGAEATRVQAAEAKRLRAAVPEGARSIALDERGEPWSTRELADRFAKWLRWRPAWKQPMKKQRLWMQCSRFTGHGVIWRRPTRSTAGVWP
jgi:23S rRNA pseudoU1915 N3-methylase RlmH